MALTRSLCISILLLLLLGVANAGAVSSVVITPSTVDGVYIVSASGLVDAALIDISFSYDVATIVNPKVVSGQLTVDSNAIMEVFTSPEGSVRVVFMADGAFKDGGQLATITFAKVGNLPGRVFDLNAEVYSNSSEQVAAQPVIGSPPSSADLISADQAAADLAAQQASQQAIANAKTIADAKEAGNTKATADAKATATGSDMSNIYEDASKQVQQQAGSNLVSVTSSGNSPVQQDSQRVQPQRDEPRRSERKSDTSQDVAQANNPPASPASAATARYDSERRSTAKNSIDAIALLKSAEMPVQRFRVFKGERTVRDLASLFDVRAYRKAGIVQVPDIAVSDGKKIVTVKIEFAASGTVPNFSLRGANLKSVRPLSDNIWELDALPQKGKSDVHLSVLLGKELVDIPLVVIPPMNASVIRETQNLAEAGINALLAKVESKSGKLVYDLNSDGRQDFIDDYILVAHYLLKNPKSEKPAKK